MQLFLLPGKFPHLVASILGPKKTSSTEVTDKEEVILNFGEVPVQSTSSKWIELHNVSPVSTDLYLPFYSDLSCTDLQSLVGAVYSHPRSHGPFSQHQTSGLFQFEILTIKNENSVHAQKLKHGKVCYSWCQPGLYLRPSPSLAVVRDPHLGI